MMSLQLHRFPSRRPASVGVALLIGALGRTAHAQPCPDSLARALPLVERPALSDTNNTLVLLLTGDGGWAAADERVADGLRARGAAVVGVNMRSYLGRRRTPDDVAKDIACVAQVFLARWHRERVMLLGYSRGADIAPFVATRWPAELRARINMVALISVSRQANFQFHLIDLVRDVHRPDDIPVAPELNQLRGLRVVCVYGSDESDSGCRDADSSIVTKYERSGGHRLTGGFDAVAEILEQGLHPPPAGRAGWQGRAPRDDNGATRPVDETCYSRRSVSRGASVSARGAGRQRAITGVVAG